MVNRMGAMKSCNHSGFTLLEMLIALAIFAMLGMATYSVLSGTIAGNEAIKQQNKQLTQIQRAFTLMESDFYQLALRRARVNGEEPGERYFIAEEYLFESEGPGLAFVRDGWVNPAMVLPRSELQPVGYRLFENRLERLYFNFVDPQSGEEPKVQPLLEGVDTMSLSYFVGEEWQEDLPDSGLPLLVKVQLETQTFGLLERIFPLVREKAK